MPLDDTNWPPRSEPQEPRQPTYGERLADAFPNVAFHGLAWAGAVDAACRIEALVYAGEIVTVSAATRIWHAMRAYRKDPEVFAWVADDQWGAEDRGSGFDPESWEARQAIHEARVKELLAGSNNLDDTIP